MQGPGALVASLGKEPHFRPLVHTPGVFLLLLALHWVWHGLFQSHFRFSANSSCIGQTAARAG